MEYHDTQATQSVISGTSVVLLKITDTTASNGGVCQPPWGQIRQAGEGEVAGCSASLTPHHLIPWSFFMLAPE